MTRTISVALKAHMAGEVMTIATCWKLTRTDSMVMGFTNHDQDIVFDAVTYKASTGITSSTNKSNSDVSVDNMEADSFLNSDEITESDIAAGVYDYAAVEVFLINYQDVTMGNLIIRSGYLGQLTLNKQQYSAEFRGMNQKLAEVGGRVVSSLCDAILGDSRCTVNLTSFTFTGTVTTLQDNQAFFASALTQGINYFNDGKITWTSGNNNGLSMEVKEFISTEVTLALPMGFTIQLGDTFSIVAGCDKTKQTCINTFNNLVNFRGFPDVPGMTKLLTTAGTLQSTQ